MNASLWNDQLQENLVCGPDGTAEGYEFFCIYTTRVAAFWLLFIAIWTSYLSKLQGELSENEQTASSRHKRRSRVSVKSSTRSFLNRKLTRTSITYSGKEGRNKTKTSHSSWITAVFGCVMFFASMSYFFGIGCVYDANDIRGQVGDAFGVCYFCMSWYMSLIQIRGADWFKSLVQLPTDNTNGGKRKLFLRMPSASTVLDSIQGPLGPVIAFILWLLMVIGAITRGILYTTCFSITALFGVRSFLAITTKRVTALRSISFLQNKIRGTAKDKKRRQAILQSKTLSLVLDLVMVFCSSVLTTASMPLLGSTLSSRQYVVHNTVLNVPNMIVLTIFTTSIHIKTKKAMKRKFKHSMKLARVHVESQMSEHSILQKTEVERSSGSNKSKQEMMNSDHERASQSVKSVFSSTMTRGSASKKSSGSGGRDERGHLRTIETTSSKNTVEI